MPKHWCLLFNAYIHNIIAWYSKLTKYMWTIPYTSEYWKLQNVYTLRFYYILYMGRSFDVLHIKNVYLRKKTKKKKKKKKLLVCLNYNLENQNPVIFFKYYGICVWVKKTNIDCLEFV